MEELHEAMYFTKLEKNMVICNLCPHNCTIGPGGYGICGARQNKKGILYSVNYGKVTSLALDPIEKKPFSNYCSHTNVLSVGTFACNFKCSFCQNWTIAQDKPIAREITPQQLVQSAMQLKNKGNIGVAYTYNEPFMWYEFVYDTCKEIKKENMKNVLVTNGFINIEPLQEILPLIDAMNIDVKAYTQEFYKNICNGRLEDVKRTVEISSQYCHVEVTTLIIPGLNDKEEEIDLLASWIKGISPDISLHLTRFFPSFKMLDRGQTPIKTLESLKKIASRHLKHVYLGNI